VGHLLEPDISSKTTRKPAMITQNVKGTKRRIEPEEQNRQTEKDLKNIG
jgi:hypothetical protein